MAEHQDSSQEKTEEATPRRLEKAREEGQVVRSRELNTAAVMIAGSVALLIFGGMLSSAMADIFRRNLSLQPAQLLADDVMLIQLKFAFLTALKAVLPFMFVVTLAALAAPMLLGGWNFSLQAISPRIDRINPLSGLKRMFSTQSLVELLKAILKFVVIAIIAMLLLWRVRYGLADLQGLSLPAAMRSATHLTVWSALMLCLGLLAIATIDVPFQLWQHHSRLRMTKQEVRDEMKEVEGKPEVKSRIRQLQREIARRRMMSNVPKADVIITNPTHYSVALKYDQGNMNAPILLAKGTDLVALKIREIATEHGVEIVEAPPLARAIYHTTELEQEIPAGLYLAVAKVLAYVFQVQNYMKGLGQKPNKPDDIELPEDYRQY